LLDADEKEEGVRNGDRAIGGEPIRVDALATRPTQTPAAWPAEKGGRGRTVFLSQVTDAK